MAPRLTPAIRRSAVLAAALSFLWPGLGQGWAGAWRRALLLGVPILLLTIAATVIIAVQGRVHTALLLIDPPVLLALLAVNVGLLAYRIFAIVDAYRLAHKRWPGSRPRNRTAVAAIVLGMLLGATLLEHGVVGYVGFKAYDTVVAISHPFSTPTPVPTPTLAPDETPGPTPIPTPRPTPEPAWGDNGRLDLLLIGGDAGPGRFSMRTDTMIILSVDIATGRAAMFGVPRNLMNVPLPPGPAAHFKCGCFPDLLNGLYVYAIAHPEVFPGPIEERGYRAVQDAISTLTGIQFDGQVLVTLQGFVKLVDALGGLSMTTKDSVYDNRYPDPLSTHDVKIFISRGFHHFDGWHALAYARSRHQDNDYNRMDRQQEVLRALRAELNPCEIIPKVPELLDIAKSSLWTNIPLSSLAELFDIGARVESSAIARFQFWPPQIHEALDAVSIARVQAMVANAFSGPAPTPEPSASSSPTPAPGSGSIC